MKDLSKILWAIIIIISCFIACDNVDDKENDNQKPNEETHAGTENDPYLVADIIAKKPQSTIEAVESDVWVEGYIVGYHNDQESPAKDYFGKQDSYLSNNNVYLADNADETNYSKCICVQIVAAFRQEVGLKAVPTNIGKKLAVKGNIMIYHSVPGVKGMITYRIDGSGPEEPPTLDSGDGTESKPYTVKDIISKNPQSTTEAVESDVWAEGYIVGYRNDQETPSKDYFGKQDSYMSNNNVYLADQADETDYSNCICIQVVSAFRQKIGLMAVPENMGKKLTVKGNIMKYNSIPGIKGMTNYRIDGVGPEEKPIFPTNGDGTESKPYSIQDIISKNPQSTTEAVESGVWAEGYIVGYRNDQETPSKDYFGKQDSYMSNNNVFLASKADETDINNCICIQVVTTFREKIGLMSVPENMGKKLAVKGNIMKYYSIPGIKEISDYKIDGVGPTPEPPIEGAILEAKFDTDLCGFTAISVIGDQVWNVNTTYKYVIISGYANKKSNQNEDWLISPAFSLKNVTSANITFTHVINKGDLNNLKTNHTLWISSDYKEGQPSTATWEQIPITTYPAGNNWNKTDSGDIPIPATYIGKDNIRIAFKYICSNSESASWEIMDLVIK